MMKAAILYGCEDMRIEAVPLPLPRGGEMVVRVCAALTCGTDLKVYRRGYHARMLTPLLLSAMKWPVLCTRPRTFYCLLTRRLCGDTKFCSMWKMLLVPARSGESLRCSPFNNGAYAEYMLIPARIAQKNTLLIPENVSLEHAALTGPLT